MKMSITGAGGFVGRQLLAALTPQGHQITVLTRNTHTSFPPGIRVLRGDLTSIDCPLEPFLSGCEVVLHCAGELRATAAMASLHVDATRRLVQAALNEAARRHAGMHWVQLSSVGAYGPPSGPVAVDRVVTEATPTNPVGEYEVTKTLADEFVVQASEPGLLSYSIVRPSNIFGATMPNASLRALGAMVRRGIFFYIGRPGAVATYVHVDDVARTLARCATDVRAKAHVFNLSNDCMIEELIDGIAAAVAVKRPWLRLPEPFVRAATRVASSIADVPLTQERINALVIRTRYPYDRLERELSLIPRISVPMAVGEVVTGPTS